MTKKSSILLIALGIVLTSAFLLPLVASATTWNAPYNLGSGGTKPAVAIDSQGGIHYVWWEPGAKIIQYAHCTGLNKNSCDAVENLPNNGGASYYPNIAIDSDDQPNVVWESKDGSSYSVYWSRRENGSWLSAKKISSEPYSELPDIAIGPQNIVHVVYQSKQDQTGYVYYVESPDGFGTSRKIQLDAVTSDQPISVAADVAQNQNGAEGQQLSNGLYPRLTADADDLAHVVWNAPSPYGIYYAIQFPTGDFDTKITVSTGHKDQTPDITIAPNGAAGILWSTYDNFNVAFAEYNNGSPDLKKYDVDGGVEQSLWPRIATDCLGIFHYTFQGKLTTDSDWNIYHRSYNSTDNKFTKRETIGDASAQEQTPAIATFARGAIVYANTSNSITNASTADLGISCNGSDTPTPTNTATQTLTPTQTNTGTPPSPTNTFTPTQTRTSTPTGTITQTNTPTQTRTNTSTATLTPTLQGGTEHIPSNDPRIQYVGTWKDFNNQDASDGSYMRCGGKHKCKKDWSAELDFVGGNRVEWETAYANTYGKADVYLDGTLFERVDLCKLRKKSSVPKFAKRTYILSGGSTAPHSIKILALGDHSNCSNYNANFVSVDGFNILR